MKLQELPCRICKHPKSEHPCIDAVCQCPGYKPSLTEDEAVTLAQDLARLLQLGVEVETPDAVEAILPLVEAALTRARAAGLLS